MHFSNFQFSILIFFAVVSQKQYSVSTTLVVSQLLKSKFSILLKPLKKEFSDLKLLVHEINPFVNVNETA